MSQNTIAAYREVFLALREKLYAAQLVLMDALTGLPIEDDMHLLVEERKTKDTQIASLRVALESLIHLIEHEVDYKNFENGVVAPDGTDEGMVRSMEIIDKAKSAIAPEVKP